MSSVLELLDLHKIAPGENDKVELLPNGEVVLYRDTDHRYFHLHEDGKKRTLYAVSSVCKSFGDSGGLVHWAWKLGSEGVDYRDVRDDAGTRGTSVHDAAELLAKEGVRPKLNDFPQEDRGYVQALANFWLDHKPEVVATEVITASLEHGFAGRYDLVAVSHGRRVLYDYKTSGKVRPFAMFCQLEAYELAEVELGREPTDARAVVRLGEDGSFEVAESCATAQDFLHLLWTFKSEKRVAREHKQALKEAA